MYVLDPQIYKLLSFVTLSIDFYGDLLRIVESLTVLRSEFAFGYTACFDPL